MSEAHRYSVVKMLSESGNKISYTPHGPQVVLASNYDALLARAEAAERDAAIWNEIIVAVVREIPDKRSTRDGNAPGHAHSVPGVWDSDNGVLAGTECAWCKTWNAAKEATAESAAMSAEHPATPQ